MAFLSGISPVYLSGFFLWLPSLSIPIADAWGVQGALFFSVAYVFFQGKVNVAGFLFCCAISFFFLISTVCGIVPVARGALSLLSELTLVFVAYSVFVGLGADDRKRWYFLRGYTAGAIFSSLVALIQFVGLNFGLSFFAWEFVNPSFTALGADTFEFHKRAYSFTPEPSILSGLLLSAIAIQVVAVRSNGSHFNWLVLCLFFVAILSTASQAIVLVPFVVFVSTILFKSSPSNKGSRSWLYVASFFSVVVFSIVVFESIQINFFYRVSDVFNDSAQGSSYSSRSETIRAALDMFSDFPFLGAGPGAFTDSLMNYVKTDDHIGAANSFVRYVSEFGVLMLVLWFFAFFILFINIFVAKEKNDLFFSQHVAMAVWFAISASTFVGYRVLYTNTIWIAVALYLCKRYGFRVTRRHVCSN